MQYRLTEETKKHLGVTLYRIEKDRKPGACGCEHFKKRSRQTDA